MASLTYETKTRTGYRLRAYEPGNSARRFSVWLGDVSPREAETAKRHIEAVIESQSLGTPMPGETQRWLGKVPDSLRRKLSPVLGQARNVHDAVDSYLTECERIHKASTVRSTQNSLESFAQHFGRQQMRSLVGEDIDRWIQMRNVSSNTAAKIAKHVKTFITWSRKQGWVDDLRISVSSAVGVGSKDYVEVKDFDRLIKHFAKQPQMRCALALARWAGLRVPSEVLTLTRSSVDFDALRLHIIDSSLYAEKTTMRAHRRCCP
jgi:integrase